MTNGKMATVNGAGPGAYHAAGGGRACESCYSEFLFVTCICQSMASVKVNQESSENVGNVVNESKRNSVLVSQRFLFPLVWGSDSEAL